MLLPCSGLTPRLPRYPLFPYTTLFRSVVGRCEGQAEHPDEGEQHQQRRGQQQYEVHDPALRGAGAWKQLARFLDLGGGHRSLPARSATNVSPAMKANSTKAIAEAEPMLE